MFFAVQFFLYFYPSLSIHVYSFIRLFTFIFLFLFFLLSHFYFFSRTIQIANYS